MTAATTNLDAFSPRDVPISKCVIASVALIPFAALILLLPGVLIAIPSLLAVPAAGIVVAEIGRRAIRRMDGELGGRRLAMPGIAAHTVVLVAALGWSFYLYRVINPPGHHSLTFRSLTQTPSDVEPLVGQNVVIGGWMHPTRESDGLTHFWLVDHLENNFGAYYKSHQQALVLLRKGETLDYQSGDLIVTGRLEVFDHSRGCPAGDCPAYMIHADHVRVAPVSAELMNQ